MSFNCPHCNKEGVSYFSKLLSYSGSPATCRICGKFSCDAGGVNESYRKIAPLSLIVLGTSSLLTQSLFYISIWLGFALLFPAYSLYVLKLEKLSGDEVKKQRGKKLIALGGLVLLACLAVLYESFR
ncbi:MULTISPECIES: hypothetical protein [unclassified Pseudoalteromonas]|uniref:hypothetical protein n=1 Tax=unclassified Pseudoalteromonas TaxID=194690 RepID=UPI00209736BF|nr:hypothetical protein [Pseudoalteromonas sp. XMcav2-N]MCO7191400.1 hypothetical protein [Pseudoalteromonas sp. XMcav2-N]